MKRLLRLELGRAFMDMAFSCHSLLALFFPCSIFF